MKNTQEKQFKGGFILALGFSQWSPGLIDSGPKKG
jgi:hypothetical protein